MLVVGQVRVRHRSSGVALALLALTAVGCAGVQVPTPEDHQLVGVVSVVGGWIFSPGERPQSGGEVLLVPVEHREMLLAGTLADEYGWNDERLLDAGAWPIPVDQVEAAGARVVPIGDRGRFVFDDVEPGSAFLCRGGERSPSEAFRARGCMEIDVRPPMAITLTSVEGQLQLEIVGTQ